MFKLKQNAALIIAAAVSSISAATFSIKADITTGSHPQQSVYVSMLQPILPGAYERIHADMSLVEVQAILGAGTEISSSKTTEIYVWKDSAGNSITGVFENGRLIEKSRPNP